MITEVGRAPRSRSRVTAQRILFPSRNVGSLAAIVALALLGGGPRAVAPQEPHAGESDWQVALGGVGLLVPAYEGSDDFRLRGFPAADITYRNRFFLNARHGLGAYIVNTGAASAGIGVFYTGGRDEDDSRDLAGTGDIDGGADLNAFIEYAIGSYDVSLEASHQVTGDDSGTRVEVGAGYSWWISRGQVMLSPGVSASYASGHYMDAYFGITAQQAAASGYAPYDTSAGFKSVSLDATGLLFPTERWMLLAVASLGYLTGDEAASPLVRRRIQPGILLGLLFRL